MIRQLGHQVRRVSTLTERQVEQIQRLQNKVHNKIKGTFLETWVKYWKVLARDYIDVAVSVKQDFKDRPFYSTGIVTGLSFLGYCATHNPDQQSFRAKYIQCSNNVALVATSVVNPEAVAHLKYMEQCHNANLIRYTNLGIFTIVWVDKYSDQCDTYESNCSYLKVGYFQIPNRILDIGFLNTWWVTSRKMLNYDVNY